MPQDATFHDRRLEQRLRESPEFRAEFERQEKEITTIDGRRSEGDGSAPTMREWLDDSSRWEPVDVEESLAEARAAERDRDDE